MSTLTEYLIGISAGGTVITLVAKKAISLFFKVQERAFEIEAQTIASKYLEEQKIKFSKFHTERADFLKNVYEAMQLFLKEVSEAVVCSSQEVKDKLDKAGDHYENFHLIFLKNKILISPELESIIVQFIDVGEKLIKNVVQIEQAMPNRKVDMKRLDLLDPELRRTVESIIIVIETEFRKILQ